MKKIDDKSGFRVEEPRIITQNTPAWIEARRAGIGGSDAAAVLGLSRFSSPLNVFISKTEPDLDEPIDSPRMAAGRFYEDATALRFEAETGLRVQRVPYILKCKCHPWMLGNLDRRIVGLDAGVEIKFSTSPWAARDWADNAAPIEYQIQCHHYMIVTGWRLWYLFAFVAGVGWELRTIKWDDDIARQIIDGEMAFWQNHVLPKIPPIVDGSNASTELLKRLYPDAGSSIIELRGDEWNPLIDERDRLKAELKEKETRLSEIENRLKQEIGENSGAKTDQYLVHWKQIQSSRLDTKSLEATHPDIAAQFTRPSSYRRMRIKKMKGE